MPVANELFLYASMASRSGSDRVYNRPLGGRRMVHVVERKAGLVQEVELDLLMVVPGQKHGHWQGLVGDGT